MKEFARPFYESMAWRRTRKAYTAYVGGLCESCWAEGIAKPGEIVHHKIPLTPENINDTGVTLNYDNLMLVCRDCHAKEHADLFPRKRRYRLDELGRVIFD